VSQVTEPELVFEGTGSWFCRISSPELLHIFQTCFIFISVVQRATVYEVSEKNLLFLICDVLRHARIEVHMQPALQRFCKRVF